jgi:hypothetical protein
MFGHLQQLLYLQMMKMYNRKKCHDFFLLWSGVKIKINIIIVVGRCLPGIACFTYPLERVRRGLVCRSGGNVFDR